jgi:Asp-tRNA(Asn)/Glu-tRNA(Gln) amidotransferase A subunit family amidase
MVCFIIVIDMEPGKQQFLYLFSILINMKMQIILLRKISFIIGFIICSFTVIAQDSVSIQQEMGAEKMYGLQFSNAKRDSMLDGLSSNIKTYQFFHDQNLPNNIPLSISFDPVLPGMHFNKKQQPIVWDIPLNVDLPKNKNELAFYSLPQLASLIKYKKISSVELTKFFIQRLKKYGDTLHCVIELTEDIALQQAKKADDDLAKGIYKSPLQGIPYGIKDLFAVKGTHTTWGTPPYKNQVIDQTAFVAQQLQDAGAVLVAKLSLGELAMDDVWFGGLTRNPWNLNKGSGGSSAGSSSATAAGLVPFAIGTETYGSIVDPSWRCGLTGLRPTFGSISRSGAMALAWSSDKVGAICRSAEDAAIVFAYIHGTDGKDASARNMPFNYTGKIDLKKLKVAYAKNYIDSLPDNSPEKKLLTTLKNLGVKLIAVDFPDTLHGDAILNLIVAAESAAAFDPLTRSNQDDEMVQQKKDRWPNIFRTARFIPAVEYINACRMRYSIMQKVDPFINEYDIIIAPPETGDQLAITNLTGHPSVTLPIGFDINGMPVAITFIGHLYDEAKLLAFAKAYQSATTFNQQHPLMFK